MNKTKARNHLLLLILTSLLCSAGCQQEHVHTWLPATCTEPRICSQCGEREPGSEPLGHDWMATTCIEPRTCSRCGATEGEPLGHDWTEATCTEPKTCSRCGETEGEPLGHDWLAATCTEPKTCSLCGETEGEPLGHLATGSCLDPQICSRCGEKLGGPLGHSPADPVQENVVLPTCVEGGKHDEVVYCTRCHAELSRVVITDAALGHQLLNGQCVRCGAGQYAPLRGDHNGVIPDVHTWEGIYRAHIINRGNWDFVVWATDADGNIDMIASGYGAYEGTVLLLGRSPYTIEVESRGKWTIELEKLETVPLTTFSGKGDYVTDIAPLRSGKLRFSHPGKSHFLVWMYTTEGETLLIHRLGTCEETVPIQVPEDSNAFFMVRADGNWKIELEN